MYWRPRGGIPLSCGVTLALLLSTLCVLFYKIAVYSSGARSHHRKQRWSVLHFVKLRNLCPEMKTLEFFLVRLPGVDSLQLVFPKLRGGSCMRGQRIA